jgi:AraC-like DNA-binding protein
MASLIGDPAAPRLERSCGAAPGDWLRLAPAAPGLERMEAFFAGHGFAPHRHDSYAMGFTLAGVQSFRYRGAAEHSTAGELFVLHPDETHDGRAGTGAGFRYRILYVEPRAIQDALGGAHRALPFLRAPVTRDRRLAAALRPALDEFDRPLEELEREQIILALADALAAGDASTARRRLSPPHGHAAARARDFLDAHPEESVASAALEAVAGVSRYALARHFRACFGTSPYRYQLLRRLDQARALIRQGAALADAALASGFADQSHMTRQFGKAYGVSPGRWAALAARGDAGR